MQIYYDQDADLNLIKQRKIAIFGYGSQGHAHAQNLQDSGANVVVALRDGSQNKERVIADGLPCKTLEEASAWADFFMVLVPDQCQRDLYETHLKQLLQPGDILAFAHGFNIHYQEIKPPNFVDVVMIAPKSPGHLVRKTYQEGIGTPCLVAVHQNSSGNALNIAVSYAKAIGGTKAGTIETNFKNETETDLFGEQAVLCGGVSMLIKAGFETLTEAGYPPELAYFECLHEIKLIVDLFYEGGLSLMNYSVSDTAEYGGYTRGPRVLPEKETKERMKKILEEVQNGSFAREYLADCANGQADLLANRNAISQHQIETVGQKLRAMMPWLQKNLVKETIKKES